MVAGLFAIHTVEVVGSSPASPTKKVQVSGGASPR